jgi:hypothetical protein
MNEPKIKNGLYLTETGRNYDVIAFLSNDTEKDIVLSLQVPGAGLAEIEVPAHGYTNIHASATGFGLLQGIKNLLGGIN